MWAQCVNGDGGHDRTVDPAREPQQHLLKTGLAHIVAQGFDHYAVVLLHHVRQARFLALQRFPAVLGSLEINMGQTGLHDRHLHGQPAAAVQHERAAVKHLVILCSDHIDIDQGDIVLDDTADDCLHPDGELVAKVWRSIRHHQNLRPALDHGLANVRIPRVFADRISDAHTIFQRVWPRDIGALEQADLIKNIEIGQKVFARTCHNLTAAQGEIGIIKPIIFDHRAADRQGRTIGTVLRKLHQLRHGIGDECWFHNKILGLVADQKHLWQRDKIGPRRFALGPCCAGLLGVACDVAHGGVQLRHCQAK